MARAKRVSGIKPRGPFHDNAQRVVEVRLKELVSWRTSLDDPGLVSDLHDMRIAAKRLRYALEMFEICFPESGPVLKELGALQDELGDIHDLDILTGLLRTRLEATDDDIEPRAVEIMGDNLSARQKNSRIRQMLVAHARNERRLGLVGLVGDKLVERHRRYESLREKWAGAKLDDFAQRVRIATDLEEVPPVTGTDHMPEEEEAVSSQTDP